MIGSAAATPSVRGLSLVHAGLGAGLLIAPDRRLGAPSGWRGRAFAWLLGARYIGQAVLTAQRPDRRRLRAGAAVDGAHAASMVALAAISPRWRRAAMLNVGCAVPLAVTGWCLASGTGNRTGPRTGR